MSDGKRSFWSSIPGLITGLAGLLTGVVGLITLLVQQGLIGHDSGNKATVNAGAGTTVTTTAAATGGTSTNGGSPSTTEAGSFAVIPTAVDFPPTDQKPKTVTVKNTSASAALTVRQPTVTGTDAAQFSVSLGTCTAKLPANLTCTMQVTFTPPTGAALKQYTARLQVQADGAPAGNEVALTASTLL